jgi:hypothetical protein
VHFGEYYKANCQLLGETCRMCFILGITSMLTVLIMIFMANFDDGQEPDSRIGKWLFCGVLLSISSLAIFIYILNWSTGSTGDTFGRMPRENETFTFKPKGASLPPFCPPPPSPFLYSPAPSLLQRLAEACH